MFTATLDQRGWDIAKYKASLRYAFRGTALDWQIETGRAARLPAEAAEFVGQLQDVLFHVNHVYTLGFTRDLRKRLFGATSKLPIILETHDVQSQLLQDYKSRNPWTRKLDQFDQLVRSEAKQLQKADVLIHLSVDDARLFRELLPSKPQFLVFPTIDQSFRSKIEAVCSPTEAIDLLFVGQWHRPNFEAVRWFLEQVWPLISQRGYRLKIVGPVGPMIQKELPSLYEAFCPYFVGEVPDLAPWYRSARCVIAPMVSGSGTSIKTIEALALGKPFVGTSKAFRGMPMERLKEVGIKPHDDPQSFAAAIDQALSSAPGVAAASRAAYESIFSTSAAFAERDKALEELKGQGKLIRIPQRIGVA